MTIRLIPSVTAGATAATFTILKAGSARTFAANETLNIVSIGAGGQAASDIQPVASQNIVALCDVDQDRAAGMFNKFPNAKQFINYRIMLQEMDWQIDAVIVGTPDHHHFPASMAAIRPGKHVDASTNTGRRVWRVRPMNRRSPAHCRGIFGSTRLRNNRTIWPACRVARLVGLRKGSTRRYRLPLLRSGFPGFEAGSADQH